MFPRLCKPSLFQSFLLLGPRGTGKSTLLREMFGFAKDAPSGSMSANALYLDLLAPDEEAVLSTRPQTLSERALALPKAIEWIIIDEIQKIPKLLDTVHQLIEASHLRFALTGSSARKLKAGCANLLAGRASVFHLAPLTYLELGEKFVLDDCLSFGSLPRVVNQANFEDRNTILRAYAQTYLKEEVWGEQLVRNIDPFRKFLEVTAQMNGKIVNFASMARDTGVDPKTVQSYYQILEETLLGFSLEAFEHSFRKRLARKPKFYLFDTGVTRALSRTLTLPLLHQTSAFGCAFEHFVIVEAHRIHAARERDFRFSYLLTKDGVEVDLVIERPGLPLALVEIKSAEFVHDSMLMNLEKVGADIGNSVCYCLCREKARRRVGKVEVVPWAEGLTELLN